MLPKVPNSNLIVALTLKQVCEREGGSKSQTGPREKYVVMFYLIIIFNLRFPVRNDFTHTVVLFSRKLQSSHLKHSVSVTADLYSATACV